MITIKFLKRRFRIIAITEGIILLITMLLLWLYKPNYYNIYGKSEKQKGTIVTGNTIRIPADNAIEAAVSIAQITYAATFDEDKPNAVILVNVDKTADAVAAAAVIHHPINAPILYINKDTIPEITLAEIKRLDPQGVFVDGNVKAYLIGDIGENVAAALKDLKLKYRHIKGSDPYTLGKNISDYLSTMHGNHKDVVMIAPIENPEYGLVQASWNAHMGDGFLYVEKNSVPEKTKEALQERFGGAYIYLLGSKDSYSNEVLQELSKLGHVQWIPSGETIYNQAVGFAGYKDVGRNFGWWIDKKTRDFGWGISEAGHNLIFVNPDNIQMAVPAAILSHKGKHGPMVLLKRDEVPEKLQNYLKLLKPYKTTSNQQLYNHGWIIGNESTISKEVQWKIDSLLQYD